MGNCKAWDIVLYTDSSIKFSSTLFLTCLLFKLVVGGHHLIKTGKDRASDVAELTEQKYDSLSYMLNNLSAQVRKKIPLSFVFVFLDQLLDSLLYRTNKLVNETEPYFIKQVDNAK